jgi:hypothetical protein
VFLNLTGSIGFSGNGDNTNRTYTISFGPRYMLPLAQRDRFFIGVSADLFALTESGRDTHWGGGPEIAMGVDCAISNRLCGVIEIVAGFAGIEYGNRGDVISPDGAGWARGRLGLRLPL